jgi:hypothetical protein
MNPDVKAASVTIQKMIQIKLGKTLEEFLKEELDKQSELESQEENSEGEQA